VFRLDDMGRNFYIILHGTVRVLVKVIGEKGEENLTEVSSMTKGASFGELALLKDAQRGASILCKTNCHFATLTKQSYKRILGKLHIKRFDAICGMLRHQP
jgi:cAMP-dependent protein kinase regulator